MGGNSGSRMTVADLIALLQKEDPEAVVYCDNVEDGPYEASEVRGMVRVDYGTFKAITFASKRPECSEEPFRAIGIR